MSPPFRGRCFHHKEQNSIYQYSIKKNSALLIMTNTITTAPGVKQQRGVPLHSGSRSLNQVPAEPSTATESFLPGAASAISSQLSLWLLTPGPTSGHTAACSRPYLSGVLSKGYSLVSGSIHRLQSSRASPDSILRGPFSRGQLCRSRGEQFRGHHQAAAPAPRRCRKTTDYVDAIFIETNIIK